MRLLFALCTCLPLCAQSFPTARPTNLRSFSGPTESTVAVADFDNDGDLDLATGFDLGLNNGFGDFHVTPLPVSSAERITQFVAAFDYEGDGDQDLLLGGLQSLGVAVLLLNDGSAGFTNSSGLLPVELTNTLVELDGVYRGHPDGRVRLISRSLFPGPGLNHPRFVVDPTVPSIQIEGYGFRGFAAPVGRHLGGTTFTEFTDQTPLFSDFQLEGLPSSPIPTGFAVPTPPPFDLFSARTVDLGADGLDETVVSVPGGLAVLAASPAPLSANGTMLTLPIPGTTSPRFFMGNWDASGRQSALVAGEYFLPNLDGLSAAGMRRVLFPPRVELGAVCDIDGDGDDDLIVAAPSPLGGGSNSVDIVENRRRALVAPRIIEQGGALTIDLVREGPLPADISQAIVVAGFEAAAVSTPFGTLRVNLAPVSSVPAVFGPFAINDFQRITLPIADDPSVVGLEIYAQALMSEPALGFTRLTNATRSVVVPRLP
ncbi:MAG: VCBS repeat-containing protein [Planctomycetota bacterium]